MSKIRNATAIVLLGAALLCALSGCGDPEPTATPVGPTATNPATLTPLPPTATALPPTPTIIPDTPTPTVVPSGVTVNGPAGDLLSKSVLAMHDVKSYHFSFENTVARMAGSVTAIGEGDFSAPDKR